MPKHKILATYLHQIGGFATKLASLMLVTPLLSKDKEVFGVYSVCASILLFLNYSDFGFLSAVKKCAASFNAQGDDEQEKKFIGFAMFVSIIGASVIMLGCAFAAIWPDLIFGRRGSSERDLIITVLLVLTMLGAPVVVMQRVISIAFEIRIEGYVAQRWMIGSNLLTILCGILLLRGDGWPRLVWYYGLSSLIGCAALLGISWTATRSHGYGLGAILRLSRPNKDVYDRTKSLGFTGMWATLFWLLFFEFDILYIGVFVGPAEAAVFAVSSTGASVLRSVFGFLFLPLGTHANRLIDSSELNSLKRFIRSVTLDFSPITIFPVLVIVLMSDSIVAAWVGEGYSESAAIFSIQAVPYMFSFVVYPWGMILLARELNKEARWVSLAQPVVYWSVVLLVCPGDLEGMATTKTVILIASAVYSGLRISCFCGEPFLRFLAKVLSRTVAGVLIIAGAHFLVQEKFIEADIQNGLMAVSSVCVGMLVAAACGQSAVSSHFRNLFGQLVSTIKKISKESD